jgi:RNase H-fold protein (predicted Holliday junction resolvase)
MAKGRNENGERKPEERARQRALSVAKSLLETIERAIVDLESSKDEDAAIAAEALVSRMHAARMRNRDNDSTATSGLVEYLAAVRQPIRVMDERWGGTGEASRDLVRWLRKNDDLSGALDKWTDAQILQMLRAENFSIVMGRLLGVTPKAVEARLRRLKERRTLQSK